MSQPVRWLLVGLVSVAWGCRDFPKGMDSVDHSLLPRVQETAFPDDVPLGRAGRSIRAELVIAEAARGRPERLQFVGTEANSLELLASWAGIGVEEVLRQNPHLDRKAGLEGRSVTLELDPATAARFRGLRNVHLARWQRRGEWDRRVVGVVEHLVQKGESLADILRRYPTTEDLLVRENGVLKLNALREGQRLRVPLTATLRP